MQMVSNDWSMDTCTEKDQIIDSLREKCREFSRLVGSHQDANIQVTDVSNYTVY